MPTVTKAPRERWHGGLLAELRLRLVGQPQNLERDLPAIILAALCFLLADASVRFFSQNTNTAVMAAVSIRDDGKAVTLP